MLVIPSIDFLLFLPCHVSRKVTWLFENACCWPSTGNYRTLWLVIPEIPPNFFAKKFCEFHFCSCLADNTSRTCTPSEWNSWAVTGDTKDILLSLTSGACSCSSSEIKNCWIGIHKTETWWRLPDLCSCCLFTKNPTMVPSLMSATVAKSRSREFAEDIFHVLNPDTSHCHEVSFWSC